MRSELTERPGERHEPLSLSAPLVVDVSIAADALRLPADVCVRLLIERGLAVEALAGALGDAPDGDRVARVVADLDRLAADSRANCELSAASSAYAQTLLFGLLGASRATSGELRQVAIPMRLVDRVDEDLVRRAAASPDVEAARDWELAAVLDGLSVCEWASLAALRAASRS